MERQLLDASFECDFDPCDYQAYGESPCNSRRRVAQAYIRADGTAERVAFRCDRGHMRKWETGGMWIPLDVFTTPAFEKMFPEGTIVIKEGRRQTSFDIKDNIAYRHRTTKECAVCDTPNAVEYNLRQISNWLARYRPTFVKYELTDAIEYLQDRGTYDDGWFKALPKAVQAKVMSEVKRSRIEADHGIPRSILEAIRDELSSAEVDVARDAFTFPLCARCNGGRDDMLDDLSILATRWAKIQAPRIDVDIAKTLPVWKTIGSLYQKAYRYRMRETDEGSGSS